MELEDMTIDELLKEIATYDGVDYCRVYVGEQILTRFAEKDKQIAQLEKALEEAKCSTK